MWFAAGDLAKLVASRLGLALRGLLALAWYAALVVTMIKVWL